MVDPELLLPLGAVPKLYLKWHKTRQLYNALHRDEYIDID
jgi:hypothetical protein